MLVCPAYAQAAAGAPSGMGALAQFVPLILIFGIMYFLMIRPQQKKMRDMKAMLSSLKRGDRVVVPRGDTSLQVGDEVLVLVHDEELLQLAGVARQTGEQRVRDGQRGRVVGAPGHR